MIYEISSISNRDIQLLHEYRILRQPADLLDAVFRNSEPVEVAFDFAGACVANTVIDSVPEDAVPMLEFNTDDMTMLEDLATFEVDGPKLALVSASGIEDTLIVKIHWCRTNEATTKQVMDALSLINNLQSDVDKLNDFVKNYQPAVETDSTEGVVGNLVSISLDDEGHYGLQDSTYTVSEVGESQTYMNPSQDVLAGMIKDLSNPIRIETTDGKSRILENFYGSDITITGSGDWVLINNRCTVVLVDFTGSICASDCTHIRTWGSDNQIATLSCVSTYFTHRLGTITDVILARNSHLKHMQGGIVSNIKQVGIACTYYCQATEEPEYDLATVQGTLAFKDGTTFINGVEVSFTQHNVDTPLNPTQAEVTVTTPSSGGDSGGSDSGDDPVGDVDLELGDPGTEAARKKALYLFGRRKGFSQNYICAVLGNMQDESGFDPNIRQGDFSGKKYTLEEVATQWATVDGKNGYGLIQWTGKPAYAWLYNWCTAHSLDPDTLKGQAECALAVPMNYDLDDESGHGGDKYGHSGAGTATYNYYVYKNGNSTYGWSGTGDGTSAQVFAKLNALSVEDATRSWLAAMERPASSIASSRISNANAIKDLANREGWESEV